MNLVCLFSVHSLLWLIRYVHCNIHYSSHPTFFRSYTITTAIKPVSYTHLDVYKRQPLHRSVCKFNCKLTKILWFNVQVFQKLMVVEPSNMLQCIYLHINLMYISQVKFQHTHTHTHTHTWWTSCWTTLVVVILALKLIWGYLWRVNFSTPKNLWSSQKLRLMIEGACQ